MNEGLNAYRKYLALKRHFTNEKYDYFKYNGKTRCSLESFLKRNDRFMFAKIEKKYEGEMTEYFLANLIDHDDWVGNLKEQTYLDWKKRTQSLSYYFKNDLQYLKTKCKNFNQLFRTEGEMPILLKEYINHRVSLETMVILYDLIGYSEDWNNKLDELVWSKHNIKIKKYAPFLKYERKKMKSIFLECVFGENFVKKAEKV